MHFAVGLQFLSPPWFPYLEILIFLNSLRLCHLSNLLLAVSAAALSDM